MPYEFLKTTGTIVDSQRKIVVTIRRDHPAANKLKRTILAMLNRDEETQNLQLEAKHKANDNELV